MTGVTFPRVAASEWTKLHSLWSSRISMLVALGLVVGLGVFIPWLSVIEWDPNTTKENYDAVSRSIGGIYLAQLAFGVLGTMAVTGEYATGTIRATLAAVPTRLPVLWAKFVVFVAVTLILGTLACVLAFVVGQAIFATKGVDASFGDLHVTRAVLGAGLFLSAMGAFGLALGALLRNTAAAITTLTLVLFVVPVIVDILPWAESIGPYLPGMAGLAITSTSPEGLTVGPWEGFGLLCLYVVVTMGAAAVMLIKRDA
ncbi:MAG TPA: ABC transporter permease subunit [Solirubrobacter sp.]|nr:ABC transporter permease subunit [Solirubrobacter sp.]